MVLAGFVAELRIEATTAVAAPGAEVVPMKRLNDLEA
jgi:hypothetical protein